MPELPEVQTIVSQLDEVLRAKVIEKVEVLRQKSFSGNCEDLVGRRIARVWRKSKVIVMEFENWEMFLIGHLKMTGQLVYVDKNKRVAGGHPTADWVKELPSKHTRIAIDFTDGSKLFFNDMRVFGWLKLVWGENWKAVVDKMPPDVVDKSFSKSYLEKMVGKTSKAIKLLLMDQSKIGGVGNIYANDALYLAGILPTRKANSLTEKEIGSLQASLKEVINKGIKYGGASASDDKYVNASGLGGNYQEHFLVYQKGGEKCRKCGGLIVKISLGGRGTYFCSSCQK